MINVKDIKSLPRHSIYVRHFKLVELTSTDRYFLRKKDIERSETDTKALARGQGAKPLEAECVSINQFIFELKIQCRPIPLFPLYPLQVRQKAKCAQA